MKNAKGFRLRKGMVVYNDWTDQIYLLLRPIKRRYHFEPRSFRVLNVRRNQIT